MDVDRYYNWSEDRESELSLNESTYNQKHVPYQTPATHSKSNFYEEEIKGEQNVQVKSKLERCKEIGRLGPAITKLEMESESQKLKLFGEDCLEVEALSAFASIKANTAVFAG